MKLKYYLRGLAVGIILTTIVLSIANADKQPMTDAQVRQRALELGMVESSSLKLSDVAESTDDTTETESSETYNPSIAVVETKENAEKSEASESSSEPSTQESVETTKPAEETVASSTDGASDASKPPASQVPESSQPADETPIKLTIKSGDSSYTVSKALASAGLVEDAAEFDRYLCDNGYSRTIRTGTYEFSKGMSYEEIAKTIAR